MKQDNGIVNIHGKEYQTVALRVAKFRSSHPDYSLLTDIVHRDLDCVVMRASIVTPDGRTIATGHAEEYRKGGNKINLTSALENAETSAIGRCLAVFGMGGTEFATADEVAHAITNKRQAPASDLQGSMKWGRDNAALIDRAGLREDWDNALDAEDVPALRAIAKAAKSRGPDTSPVTDSEIPS